MFSSILRGHIYPSKRIAKLQLFFRLAKHHPKVCLLNKLKILCRAYHSACYNILFLTFQRPKTKVINSPLRAPLPHPAGKLSTTFPPATPRLPSHTATTTFLIPIYLFFSLLFLHYFLPRNKRGETPQQIVCFRRHRQSPRR